MKRCKLNKNKGLERFIRNKKEKRIIIGTIIGILLVLGGIKLYKTYAIYDEKASFTILKGQIPNFSGKDINLAMTFNNQKINTMPVKSNAYNVKVTCDNATGTWDYNEWGPNIRNITNVKVSCTLDFTLIYDAYIKDSSGVETKYENTNASGLDRYVPAKGNYAVTTTCANSSWNKTTWSLDVTSTVTSGSKCKVVFEPVYTYYSYNPATKTKTLINDIPTDKPYTKAICTSGSIKINGTTWNNTTKVVDFPSTPPNDTKCEVWFSSTKIEYKETILNGTDPVLADKLIPVTIEEDATGTVKKADITEKWYSYADKKWANAVILVSNPSKTYNDGDIISKDDIESYFVWIPKYKYKLWTVSETVGKGTNKTIEIEFGLNNTSDINSNECTTPGWTESTKTYNGTSVSNAIGNCVVNDYMTHPAFLAFNTNGFWVGKFETGYKGSTSKATAQVSSADPLKIQIKPDVNSWRNNTVGNMFNASYNYQRNLGSHMMKNIEWGAMAYLTSSNYGRCSGGTCTEVTLNSDSAYVTGRNGTTSYSNSSTQGGSTTGNRSGIYDTNGGAWEYVAGYRIGTNGGSSGLTEATIISNANTNYIDRYNGASTETTFKYGILGDATREMGGYVSCNTGQKCSDWYGDWTVFVYSNYPWFRRGGRDGDGTGAGTFAFWSREGSGSTGFDGFRITLAFNE